MKLFKYHNKNEYACFLENVFLSFGKVFTNDVPDGWYIRLELPFIKHMTYLDPCDFLEKMGQCRKVYLWRKRAKYSKIFKTSAWRPI